MTFHCRLLQHITDRAADTHRIGQRKRRLSRDLIDDQKTKALDLAKAKGFIEQDIHGFSPKRLGDLRTLVGGHAERRQIGNKLLNRP